MFTIVVGNLLLFGVVLYNFSGKAFCGTDSVLARSTCVPRSWSPAERVTKLDYAFCGAGTPTASG